MREPFYCPTCGTVAYPKSFTPGSFLLELLLWCMFILPGVLYTAWRIAGRTRTQCPRCKTPGMIPSSSPRAVVMRGAHQHAISSLPRSS